MTISMRRAAINLSEAVRNYTAVEEGDNVAMGRIVEAIDALPLPFPFRVHLYDIVLPTENETRELEGDTDATYARRVQENIVNAIEVSFQLARSSAEGKGEEPFAPEFDVERFKAHALSTDEKAKWAYNQAHGITGSQETGAADDEDDDED